MQINTYLNEQEYYNPNILIKILEDYYKKSFNDLKKDLKNIQITITQEDIKKYLEQKFKEENPELKQRIENKKTRKKKSLLELTSEDIDNLSKDLTDQLLASKYDFDPYTLNYLKKYSEIVRNKSLALLDIIELLSCYGSIVEYDIILKNDKISKIDIERIIKPTLENIDAFYEKVNQANTLDTYLSLSITNHSLMRHGITESEIYPVKQLQIKDLYYNGTKGTIPFSEKQKEELSEEQRRNFNNMLKYVLED